MSASHVEILEQRIVILEDTIQMLSYNLRCLNIRQGSQPIELPDIDCEDMFSKETLNRMIKTNGLLLKHVDTVYIGGHAVTPDEFEDMKRNLVCKYVPFGQDEIVWAK